jgi:MFS family permease
MLIFTMALTGLGSLWTGLVHDYNSFIAARGVTGVGIGADLAIVNTYVGELAPRSGRAKWLSFIFIMSALGATIGIWLGLILTTPSAPFPKGFPYTINTLDGWKIMYFIGAGLALLGVLLRVELPESPRWLVSQGRLDEADAITERMENKASSRKPLADPVPPSEVRLPERQATYGEIASNPLYRWRAVLMILVWSAGYVTVYSYAAGFVSVLTGLGLPPPEAGILVAVGVSGFVFCAVLAFVAGERLERKLWLPVAAVVTMAGALITGLAGKHSVTWAFFGVSIIFVGFNLWVPMTYAWSIESFPTRARTSGYALGDGLGHGAGAIGVKWVVPLVIGLTTLSALVVITSFLCFAALVAQLGVRTRNRPLDEISP